MDINEVVLVGRLTRDPELRYTPAGASVGSFSLAVNQTWVKDGAKQEKVSYINCTAWGKTAETIVEYCKKGHRLGITGRLQQRSWEDQDGKKRSAVDVVVEKFQFLQPRDSEKAEPEPPKYDDIPPAADPIFNDDDIPF